MAFNTLTIGALTYNSVGPGEYMLSTVAFGGPADMIKLSPGKKANAKAPTSASLTRIIEKDFTVGTEIIRRRMAFTLQANVPEGFTTTEADTSILLLSDLVTPAFLTRLLLGES